MSSNENANQYSQEEKNILLDTAHASIRHGLKSGCALPVNFFEYPAKLQLLRATFVTLKLNGELRGCIGSLLARETLIESVANCAYAAAFEDPRFARLTQSEFDSVLISLSILSPPESIIFASEEDLISKIRPEIDGLLLQDGFHKGTFLPSVWESLPDAKVFLQHLKQKADLPVNYWSDTIKVDR
ncbi:MAG: AmmeMemoRadiSam system protein A, partial [Gammaproteobacteria bacterium]|nr:AmmeMemoRadiSam system protein A [Gammaproteobacteria bacterium]